MTANTATIIGELRAQGFESSRVEVKTARDGFPRLVRETLSAFSNSGGGVLLLGIDEKAGFAVVEDLDVGVLRDAVASAAADQLTPPVRCEITIETFEGSRIVRVDVPELPTRERPCFVTALGTYGGSYIRSGDGDRHLSEYEVTQLLANHGQPTDDLAPVPDASAESFDAAMVSSLLQRVRQQQPQAFTGISDERALQRLGALTEHAGHLVPTMAGLLSLGVYPQEFFPQLNLTFVAYPTPVAGVPTADGKRFLDNETIDGPIGVMVARATSAVIRNMTRAAVIRGVGRSDRDEYPVPVIRELVTNALMHRDYSPLSHGTQVQVELFPDRLVVSSPGGLYGTVKPEDLGTRHATSSRNAVLARLLTDIQLPDSVEMVCENRGSGLPSVFTALSQAHMWPPLFQVQPGYLNVILGQPEVFNDEATIWLEGLDAPELSALQRIALVLLRRGEIDLTRLQGWSVEKTDAYRALSGLERLGLAQRFGEGKLLSFRLVTTGNSAPLPSSTPRASTPPRSELSVAEQQLLNALSNTPVTSKELMAALEWSYAQTNRALNALTQKGLVEVTPGIANARRYRHSNAEG